MSKLLQLLPFLWQLYIEYKQWEHKRNVQKIKDDPTGEWNKRFGHSVSDDTADSE